MFVLCVVKAKAQVKIIKTKKQARKNIYKK